jgi:hypothetical protein
MLKDNDLNAFLSSKDKDEGRAILEGMFDEKGFIAYIILLLPLQLPPQPLPTPKSSPSLLS